MEDSSKRVFNGTDAYTPTDRLRFLHPVSLLSFGSRTLPSDFSLESADCLSLYRALVAVPDAKKGALQKLDPSIFFPRGRLLKQQDVLDYECVLKERLTSIIMSSNPQDGSSTLTKVVTALQDSAITTLSPNTRNANPRVKVIIDNLIFLLCDLHAQGDLVRFSWNLSLNPSDGHHACSQPAILFSFDRSACESAARQLLETLQTVENRWRETSSKWNRKMQQWEEWKSQAAARAKQAERLRKQQKDPLERLAEESVDASWESSFDPKDPSPQFSFLGKRCSKTILNEAIEDIRWTPKWAIDALRRGIGVHHAGMNKHYRTAVERCVTRI